MKMTSWERNLTKKASREKNGGGDRKDTARKGCWGRARQGAGWLSWAALC